VRYIGIPKRFIAGEVVFRDKKDECAVDVKVTLSCEGKADEVTKTDNYGEFEGLEADKDYAVSIEQDGYSTKKVRVKTKIDMYLGEILLSRITAKGKWYFAY